MDVMASWRVENSELESWVFGTNDCDDKSFTEIPQNRLQTSVRTTESLGTFSFNDVN